MGRGLEPGQHHQTGGLPGTRWTEHGKEFALAQGKVEILHDQGFAIIALLHAVEFDECIVVCVAGHVHSLTIRTVFRIGFALT